MRLVAMICASGCKLERFVLVFFFLKKKLCVRANCEAFACARAFGF